MTRTAKVSELKAHLSELLAGVRRGGSVIVFDRNTPIARLVPYDDEDEGVHIEGPVRPGDDIRRVRGVKLRRSVDVVDYLRQSRGQR